MPWPSKSAIAPHVPRRAGRCASPLSPLRRSSLTGTKCCATFSFGHQSRSMHVVMPPSVRLRWAATITILSGVDRLRSPISFPEQTCQSHNIHRVHRPTLLLRRLPFLMPMRPTASPPCVSFAQNRAATSVRPPAEPLEHVPARCHGPPSKADWCHRGPRAPLQASCARHCASRMPDAMQLAAGRFSPFSL
jgi:hypothetical protein